MGEKMAKKELREVVVVDGVRTPVGKSGWKAASGGKNPGILFNSTAHEDSCRKISR